MNFRLTAAYLDFYVDVALRNFDGRWLAVAEIGGDKEVGLGRSSSEALEASLSSLGPKASARLLADPQLVDLSAKIRRRSR